MPTPQIHPRVPVPGSTPPRPVTAGENDANPAFSPDGRTLVFTGRRSLKKGEATLHAMPVDRRASGCDALRTFVALHVEKTNPRLREPGPREGERRIAARGAKRIAQVLQHVKTGRPAGAIR
mgnify:CR=1 FL=1